MVCLGRGSNLQGSPRKGYALIPTAAEEIDLWVSAPTGEALALQRPLPDDSLIVAGGKQEDADEEL